MDAGSQAPGPVTLAAAGRKFLGMVPASSALVTAATTTETTNCSGGGSITVTADSSSSSGAVAGDSVALTANSCRETVDGVSTLMNGSMTITVTSGSYNASSTTYPKSVSMRIVSSNFSMSQGGVTSSTNGELDISLIENSSTTASVALNSTSLSNTVVTSAGSHTVTLKDYFHKVDASSTSAIVQTSATVETNSSRFGSGPVSFSVSTPTPLQVNSSGAFVAGSLKVTGNASGLLLTVTSADTFNLQVDANGDGSYESSSAVTRSQLRAQL